MTVKGRVRDSEWLLVATSEGGEAFVYAPLLDGRPPSASEPTTPTPAPVRDTALEATFWESVKDGDAAGFKAYLEQYPDGTFALLFAPARRTNGDASTRREHAASSVVVA